MNSAYIVKVMIYVPLLLALLTTKANADNSNKLNIAIAANFLPVFNEIKPLYEAQTGVKLLASSGSTGQLYHKIRFGAPYDIFLSADERTSQRLIKEDLAVAASYFIYAQGRLVLWSLDTALPLDQGALLKTIDKNKRLAVANPKIAPYGQAAKEVLININADKHWQNTLITGQNISQTYQFIASGNVDLGFISLSQLRFTQNKTEQQENFWLVPEALHQPLKQSAVLLRKSKKPLQAKQFLAFLTSPTALGIMQRYGYEQ